MSNMKKLVAAIAVLTSGTVSAFDYREDLSQGYEPNVDSVYEQPKQSREIEQRYGSAQEICSSMGDAWAAYGKVLLEEGKTAHGQGTRVAYETLPPWYSNHQRAQLAKVVRDLWVKEMSTDSNASFMNRWADNTSEIQLLNQFKNDFRRDLAVKEFVKGCMENL